ncbi:hypothetical protein DWB84_09400 [Saccharophagus sp. K07]|nr:hypothetical protein [Saccharophagus sp. K07]
MPLCKTRVKLLLRPGGSGADTKESPQPLHRYTAKKTRGARQTGAFRIKAGANQTVRFCKPEQQTVSSVAGFSGCTIAFKMGRQGNRKAFLPQSDTGFYMTDG